MGFNSAFKGLISVSIGQHVSTRFITGSPSGLSFLVEAFLLSAMLHRVGAYFYIWLKYILMAKILVIVQYSYMILKNTKNSCVLTETKPFTLSCCIHTAEMNQLKIFAHIYSYLLVCRPRQ